MAENNFTDGYQFHDPNFNINLDAVNLTPNMEENNLGSTLSQDGGFLGGVSKFLGAAAGPIGIGLSLAGSIFGARAAKRAKKELEKKLEKLSKD